MIPDDAVFVYDGGYILPNDLQMFYEQSLLGSLDEIRIINRQDWEDQRVLTLTDLIMMYGTEYPFGTQPHTYLDPGPSAESPKEAPPTSPQAPPPQTQTLRKVFGRQTEKTVFQETAEEAPPAELEYLPATFTFKWSSDDDEKVENDDEEAPPTFATPTLADLSVRPPPGLNINAPEWSPPPGLEAPPTWVTSTSTDLTVSPPPGLNVNAPEWTPPPLLDPTVPRPAGPWSWDLEAPPPGFEAPPTLATPPGLPQTPPISTNLVPIYEPGMDFPTITEVQNWPLFHGDYEAREEEVLMDTEIEEHMEYLQAMYPMKCWVGDDITYFLFFEDGPPAYCHFCKYAPRCAREIIEHLFSPDHVEVLKRAKISKNSFEFWITHFRAANENKGKKPQLFLTFPLLANQRIDENTYPNDEEIMERMADSDMAAISFASSELRTARGEDPFTDKNHFLGHLFNSIHEPRCCKMCNYQTNGNRLKLIAHITTVSHMEKLRGISSREVNFWKNILRLETNCLKPDKMGYAEKSRKMATFLNEKNSSPIPLIDFQLDEELETGDIVTLRQNLNPLITAYKSICPEFWAEPPGLEHNLNVQCFGCSTATEKVVLTSPAEVMRHLCTNAHLQFLCTYGYNPKALFDWQLAFSQVASGDFTVYQSLRSQILANI